MCKKNDVCHYKSIDTKSKMCFIILMCHHEYIKDEINVPIHLLWIKHMASKKRNIFKCGQIQTFSLPYLALLMKKYTITIKLHYDKSPINE